MKRSSTLTLTLMITLSLVWHFHSPAPTVLSLHIGSPYVDVVRDSTFPVATRSLNPATGKLGSGITDMTKPAVILHFNDPRHRFTLPLTTFAAISYMDEKVITIATSPMLKKLPFDEPSICSHNRSRSRSRSFKPVAEALAEQRQPARQLHRRQGPDASREMMRFFNPVS